LGGVDRNAASPANLWRIHWYNKLDGSLAEVPEHVVLTKSSPVSTHPSSSRSATASR